jgi:hypothetical protein
MKVRKIGVPSIMADNDMQYFAFLLASIEAIDEEADVSIILALSGYKIVIIPGSPILKGTLIDQITILHEAIGIEIEYSKSIDISTSINFRLVDSD